MSPFGQNTFNQSGFNHTNMSRASEPAQIEDTLVQMCEHAKTNNVKMISDILLQQVENLSKTDKNYQHNLEIAGGSLEKVRFVRGANYMQQLSDIVQRQEKEISVQQSKIESK